MSRFEEIHVPPTPAEFTMTDLRPLKVNTGAAFLGFAPGTLEAHEPTPRGDGTWEMRFTYWPDGKPDEPTIAEAKQ